MKKPRVLIVLIFFPFYLFAQETELDPKNWTYLDTAEQKQIKFKKDIGYIDGLWTAWYKKDVKMAEGYYKDGKRTSEWIMWHSNGRLMAKGFYKNGKKEGKWETWRSDSTLLSESFYKNGLKHGRSRSWHKNWVGSSECNYFNGLLNGKCMEWDENGRLIKESVYKLGEIKEEVFYHEEEEKGTQ